MRLTRAAIDDTVDLERLRPFVASSDEFFGRHEHYRLLAHLSTLIPPDKTIVDIGTHQGDSALALSYGGRVVESFDVVDKLGQRRFQKPSNVHYNLEDLWEPTVRTKHQRMLLESGLVLIDIAPHEGTSELELVEWLRTNDYRGIIVLDDIWFYKAMRDNTWYQIEPQFKTDVTDIGHWSGTGLVTFGERIEFEDERDTSNWTLVTAYFDLTRRVDASAETRARPATHYIDQHGQGTLMTDKNLIVFCDPELEERVWRIRPDWLHAKTKVVPMRLDDFQIAKYYWWITLNREGNPQCRSDPRNTASYYLLCMARYEMMRRATRANPFKSSHFAWINICIERMGYKNLVYLDDVLRAQRDKFSTCWIDYVPKSLTANLPEYFGGRDCIGRCSMASGFFTGSAPYLKRFCDAVESEFLRCLKAGFGHSDEQLYPLVYFKDPELFDWYVGDYNQAVTNYANVREAPEAPIRNLIRNSLEYGDKAVCRRACEILRNAQCDLERQDAAYLQFAEEACAR